MAIYVTIRHPGDNDDFGFDKSIFRMDSLGNNVVQIASGLSGMPLHMFYNEPDGNIYWYSNGKINRVDYTGNDLDYDIAPNVDPAYGFVIDNANNKMFTIRDGGRLHKSDMDGSNDSIIWAPGGIAGPMVIDISEGYIFTLYQHGGQIWRCNLDGSGPVKIVDYGVGNSQILDMSNDLGGKKLYWTDTKSEVIRRCNYDGSNIETIISSQGDNIAYIDINQRNNKIYWTEAGSIRGIFRCNLNGGGIQLIYTPPHDYHAFYISANTVDIIRVPVVRTNQSSGQSIVIRKNISVKPNSPGVVANKTINIISSINMKILNIKAVAKNLDITDFNGNNGHVNLSVEACNQVDRSPSPPQIKNWNLLFNPVDVSDTAVDNHGFSIPEDGEHQLNQIYVNIPNGGGLRIILTACVDDDYIGDGSVVDFDVIIDAVPMKLSDIVDV